MRTVALVVGCLGVAAVLKDAFETVVLPRRVRHRFRITNFFYVVIWPPYRAVVRKVKRASLQDSLLGYFGPLWLLLLLISWAIAMIIAFALIQWGLGSSTSTATGMRGWNSDLYFSASSFVTLGLGDVTPLSSGARFATVTEAGLGLGFLAIVISYLPVLYQTSSHREILISRLDVMAGSPPSGIAILRRHAKADRTELRMLFTEWELWAAELMDSIQSFPILAHYRSQHADQSWLTALTCVLDACSLSMCEQPDVSDAFHPAEMAFAMGCHAAEDICEVFHYPPAAPCPERLDATALAGMHQWLSRSGSDPGDAVQRFAALRSRYEPFVLSLSDRLLLPLPPLVPSEHVVHDAHDHHH